jgi:FtsP/CotA-like multicopper oxidase with cupredoxin domain
MSVSRPSLPWLLLLLAVAPGAFAPPAPPARVVANDNRVAAGTLRDGVLTLVLVAREAEWHPDGDDAPGVSLPAFAEEGHAARIPGPMLRARAGTIATVTVRNALGDTLRVYGLVDRTARGVTPADTAPLVVAPGARARVRVRLDAPGTYLYWGTTTRRALPFRTGRDAQLSAAIVVDAAEAPAARPRDHVLVLTSWSDTTHRSGVHQTRLLMAINGRVWPRTTSLTHEVGDTVALRIVNASADLHPIHLHGFHFRVLARHDLLGTGAGLVTDPEAVAVTEGVSSGTSVALAWVPTRAGNWLLHCHVPEHFGPRGALGMPPDAARQGHGVAGAHGGGAAHARGGMGGMVVGITVRPRPGAARVAGGPTRDTSVAPRRLRLLVRPTVGSTADAPHYAYALHEGRGTEPAADTGLVVGPTLDLERDRPVAVTVVNRLPEPTAVHWHGIELDAYYDGVPGYSGAGRRTTPMIAPGDSFVVHFTPPRAGTFIYHTHADELRQQTAGLVGAIVVHAPGTPRDPAIDVPVVITSPVDARLANRVALFDAHERPVPLVMVAGRRHRLRFVQMSVPRAAVTVELRRDVPVEGDSVATWRILAKDGADVPDEARAPRRASRRLSVGETLDVEVAPEGPGGLRLEVRFGISANGRRSGEPLVVAAQWPIRVVTPAPSAGAEATTVRRVTP